MQSLNLDKEELKKIIKTKDLIVSIITKNSFKIITQVLKNVQKYTSYFYSYKIIIIDRYSTDGTYNICKMWSKYDPNNRECYRQPSQNLPDVLSIIESKNMVLSLTEDYFKKNTYLLKINCDENHSELFDEECLISCFDYDTDNWDVIISNNENNNITAIYNTEKLKGFRYSCHLWYEEKSNNEKPIEEIYDSLHRHIIDNGGNIYANDNFF